MSEPTNPVIQIRFESPERRARRFESLGGGLYRRADKTFWERPKINGKRSIRKLGARTEKLAREELARNRSDQILARKQLAIDPYASPLPAKSTIDSLAAQYIAAGCPGRSGFPYTSSALTWHTRRVNTFLLYFGKKQWTEISLSDCTDYFQFRVKGEKRAGSTRERLVELELSELSNLFRWAHRHDKKTGVTHNPIAHDRPRFRDSKNVHHAREGRPKDGDELHALLAPLFAADRVSHSIAWAYAYACLTGQRISEVLTLRRSAKVKGDTAEPGFIIWDKHGKAKRLYQYRSLTHKGTFDHVDRQDQPALPILITAHFTWLKEYFPHADTFFPNRTGKKPIVSTSVNQALQRVSQLSKRETAVRPHGGRAFRIQQMRSARDASGRRKYTDAEVADHVGHKTPSLIRNVYGDPPDDEITWLPKTVPLAWSALWPAQTPRPSGPMVQLHLPLRTPQLEFNL